MSEPNESNRDEKLQELRERLERLISQEWGAKDREVQVSSRILTGGTLDFTVISHLFEGRDGLEREADFWPVFASVERSEMIFLAYCLLITPAEATRCFATDGRGVPASDAWE